MAEPGDWYPEHVRGEPGRRHAVVLRLVAEDGPAVVGELMAVAYPDPGGHRLARWVGRVVGVEPGRDGYQVVTLQELPPVP